MAVTELPGGVAMANQGPVGAPADATLVADDVHVEYSFDVSGMRRLRSLFARERHGNNTVHAIRGVSLTARSGDVIGLLGRNGAGKSTLLRAMAGLLPVVSGTMWAVGQPVRLGVGAVLEPTLPAAENIMLGCLAMGMTRPEIEEMQDDIIAFAGIGAAADRPLSGYSSGMRSRIHFAIATAARPEILMVDEALSVGDAAFKRRSRERLLELAEGAHTVFIVSHNPADVTDLCTRAVWLEQGRIHDEGDVEPIVSAYQEFMKTQN